MGASGAGTTTLGRLLATRLALQHFDTDDYFWLITEPPYQVKRAADDRFAVLKADLESHTRCVVSGALCGWGDAMASLFDAVIFIDTPTELRLERTRHREQARFGSRIQMGGDMHRQHLDFLEWSASYDDPTAPTSRSRRVHESWLSDMTCPVVRVYNGGALADLLDDALAGLAPLGIGQPPHSK